MGAPAPEPPEIRPAYRALHWLSLAGSALLYRLRAYGRERVPQGGGLLIVANHQSFLDPPLIGAAAPRELDYFARASLFANPIFARAISFLNAIPVDRERRADSGAMRTAIERLAAGRALLVFPEGRRTETGEVGPFERGFALLARRAPAPVLPAAIDGAFRAWPRARRAPRLFVPCAVAFGRPLDPRRQDLVEAARAEVVDRLQWLRRRPAT